jgi:hypothetical protein
VIELDTDRATYQRDVRAVSGYLSGDVTRLHLGFPKDANLQRLRILWPDGKESTVTDLEANTRLTVRR